MLKDAQVSLELDEFVGGELGGRQLVERTCQKFHQEYLQALTDLKAEMIRKTERINIFALAIIVWMTAKTVLMIIFVEEYNYWFFINLSLDLIVIVVVFIYSLCKIIRVAKQHNIDIYKCYLFMHFASIILLTLTWGTDFFYYIKQ